MRTNLLYLLLAQFFARDIFLQGTFISTKYISISLRKSIFCDEIFQKAIFFRNFFLVALSSFLAEIISNFNFNCLFHFLCNKWHTITIVNCKVQFFFKKPTIIQTTFYIFYWLNFWSEKWSFNVLFYILTIYFLGKNRLSLINFPERKSFKWNSFLYYIVFWILKRFYSSGLGDIILWFWNSKLKIKKKPFFINLRKFSKLFCLMQNKIKTKNKILNEITIFLETIQI